MLALARRAGTVQFRRAQLLMPTFVLPLMLLAVIASGTRAAQGLRGFPDVASYLGFVVPGTVVQGALLAGLTGGVALAFGARYPGGLGAVAAVVALAAVTAVGLGGIAAAIALRTGSLSLLQSVFPFVFVLLFTAPAFFPRELLSPVLRDLAPYNPLTYVVEACRGLLAGDDSLGDPLAGAGAALALAVATTALATFALAERLRRT